MALDTSNNQDQRQSTNASQAEGQTTAPHNEGGTGQQDVPNQPRDAWTPTIPAPAPKAVALPVYLLPLTGGGALLGALAVAIAVITHLRLGQINTELRRQIDGLRTRLDAHDNKRATTQGQEPPAPAGSLNVEAAVARALSTKIQERPTAASANREFLPPLIGTAAPAQAPATSSSPTISKAGLIQAVNLGDRQTVREHCSAQLNITKDSENALAIGRSQPTQLEEVSGGGSYWLANVAGQPLLFPTDITLKGFLSVQPNKGLYSYDKQLISNPQLIEPALLRRDGDRWTVESLGRVAIP